VNGRLINIHLSSHTLAKNSCFANRLRAENIEVSLLVEPLRMAVARPSLQVFFGARMIFPAIYLNLPGVRMGKRRILFLCTGNACRSPMAEAWLRHLAPERYESLSAGSGPAGWIHPFALEVLKEAGVDPSGLRSKSVREFLPPRGTPPDVLVALCDHALSRCPDFPPGVARMYWPVFDPILARGSDEERLAVFRSVRDEIRARIEQALEEDALDMPPDSPAGPTAPGNSKFSGEPGAGPSGRGTLPDGEDVT